ncbi:predicted protein [Verticillium alfalfae VaMs.102]|uniref:Sensitive to high expression protein 9, mitochondrial n=1 Tax=Verticillium alfalfae (strain VaMs.102 / ATCC MYA-4576 / FGSC 10136) TaxID=526221 RepID=C9SFW3_VERA1|nr:predicted protein [Verticillium alfalfae VaMs.102]EEY17367.1 predicted protein [Verticillium alfalfae VaMs.102]
MNALWCPVEPRCLSPTPSEPGRSVRAPTPDRCVHEEGGEYSQSGRKSIEVQQRGSAVRSMLWLRFELRPDCVLGLKYHNCLTEDASRFASATAATTSTTMQSLPLARPASWRLMNQLARPSPTPLAARRHLQLASSLTWQLLRPSSPSSRLYSSSNSPPPPPPPSPPPKPSESESNPDSTKSSSDPLIESRPDPVTTNSPQPFLRDGSLPKSESTTSRPSSSPSSKDASSPSSSDAPPSSRTPSPFDQLSSRVQSSQLLTTTIPRLIDTLQVRLLTASQTLNDLTGYTSIERIKTQNEALETSLAAAHQRLRATRQSYKNATGDRAATQRETTTLLARERVAFLSEPALWRDRAEDLYSERRIDLRMRDASILALQGAAAGAAVASGVVFMLLRRT